LALALSLVLAGCDTQADDNGGDGEKAATVTEFDLTEAVTAPIEGASPQTEIDSPEYSAAINWQTESGAPFTGASFAARAVYSATLSLAPKEGFTLDGLAEDAFTHSGASAVAYDGEDAQVTITFPRSFNSAPLLASRLQSAEDGTVAESPLPLDVYIDLNDQNNGWTALLAAIKDGGKYIALDISSCLMAGTEFDPGSANTGEPFIVKLALPLATKSTKAGTSSSGTDAPFRFFTSLKEIEGDGILSLGAFMFCASGSNMNTILTTASFPNAEEIGRWAFAYCSNLAVIEIPKAITIGATVFRYNKITSLDLPLAETIDSSAFLYCTSLETLNIPSIKSLGDSLFEETGAAKALSITMGSAAPDLRGYTFGHPEMIGGPQPPRGKRVTVRIPSGATGYTDAWKTKFGTSMNTITYETISSEE
jgi:hypothetical protein